MNDVGFDDFEQIAHQLIRLDRTIREQDDFAAVQFDIAGFFVFSFFGLLKLVCLYFKVVVVNYFDFDFIFLFT